MSTYLSKNDELDWCDELKYGRQMYRVISNADMALIHKTLKRYGGDKINKWYLMKGKTQVDPIHVIMDMDKDIRLDVLKVLIQKGADVNMINALGNQNWLHAACEEGHVDIANLMIRNGANVNLERDRDNSSPLIIAAMYGHADIVDLLIQNGADVNAVDNYKWTALHHASQQCHDDVALRLLQSSGAHVNALDDQGLTPLYLASSNGYIDIAKVLISNGADVNAGAAGAFVGACQGGKSDVAKLLIRCGADVNQLHRGNSLLHTCAYTDLFDVVRILIAKGLDVNAENDMGNTPIIYALEGKHMMTFQLLFCIGCARITGSMLKRLDDNKLVLGVLKNIKWIRQHDNNSCRIFTQEEREFLLTLGYALVIKFRGIGRRIFDSVLTFMSFDGYFMSELFLRGDKPSFSGCDKVLFSRKSVKKK